MPIGSKIAKKYEYELIPNFFDIIYILDNWNGVKRIAYGYDYHEKQFFETFKRYDDWGIVNIMGYDVNVIKKFSDEFEVIVHNVDGRYNEKSRHFLKLFLKNVFNFRKGKVYFRDVLIKSSVRSHELKLVIRKLNLIRVRSLFDGSTVEYYHDKNTIVLGKSNSGGLYVITEINGKSAKYYIERTGKIPRINRIALNNRKIQFQIFRMLLNKGVLKLPEKPFSIIPVTFRVSRIRPWEFSLIYQFDQHRIRTNVVNDIAESLMSPILIDYNYDDTNQILLKLADPIYGSLLCGLDYKNDLWCMQLPGITKYWRISKVYKYMYDLDEYTKVFNY